MATPKNTYPPAWKSGEIQFLLHESVGWECEHCAMQFPIGSTKAKTARNKDGKPSILTVHHLDGNPSNCDFRNLLACCQACHLHIQAVWKPGGVIPAQWGSVPEWVTRRGLPYTTAGFQLNLF